MDKVYNMLHGGGSLLLNSSNNERRERLVINSLSQKEVDYE